MGHLSIQGNDIAAAYDAALRAELEAGAPGHFTLDLLESVDRPGVRIRATEHPDLDAYVDVRWRSDGWLVLVRATSTARPVPLITFPHGSPPLLAHQVAPMTEHAPRVARAWIERLRERT